jgi:hypothetical protein
MIEVDLIVTASHDIYHGSSVVSGLVELAHQQAIRLRLCSSVQFDPQHDGMVLLDLRHPAKGSRRVAVDLSDLADRFSMPMLEDSDVYFKRSFVSRTVREIPSASRERIIPLGLNFASISRPAIPTHIRIAALLFTDHLHRLGPRHARPALRTLRSNFRHIFGIPAPSIFESTEPPARLPLDAPVLLQTRIWPPEPSPENLEEVNEQRVRLVQALREHLGNRFVGGIVADEYSTSRCPAETLVHQRTNRWEYAKLLRNAAIGVYVRGLHDSMAFKMAEYLAAGLCIVSEPLKHELPVPLIEGTNYLVFHTPEECAAQCRWLAAHPQESTNMRAANLEYYRQWVSPKASASNLLHRSFQIS